MPSIVESQSTDLVALVYQQSTCLSNAQEISIAINTLASQINADLQDANPLVLVVMTGGLIFAGQLLPQLGFSLEIDFCQVSRYKSGTQGEKLKWVVEPTIELADRLVVIVDDIYDQGTTMLELVQSCKQRGAIDVVTCVLVNKLHDRKQNPYFKPDYIALEMPDKFLVGYGMDYNGLGRNLPGIYAINL